MGGRVADGVFMRVGTDQGDDCRDGAQDSSRGPRTPVEIRVSIPLGIIFHTVLVDDPDEALTMGKAMAAGYYEYSPMLFEPSGSDLGWARS